MEASDSTCSSPRSPRRTAALASHTHVSLGSSYSELKWPSELPLDRPNIPETPPSASGEETDNEHSPTHDDDDNENCVLFANLPPLLEADRTALLIVDVQPEYWSECEAVRRDFAEFPERLASTIATARHAGVAEILWVRADYRYSHSPWLKQFARIHGRNKAHFRTEVPCDPESREFQWEDFATPLSHETVLPKTSWSSTSNTALMDILQTSGIDTVLVCGLITSVCVQHSAFGVFEAGYRTLLVQDACADRGRARHEAALALYADYMYTTVTSDELPQLFASLSSSTTCVEETAAAVSPYNSSNSGVTKADAKTTLTTVTSSTSLASQWTSTSGSRRPDEDEASSCLEQQTAVMPMGQASY